MSKKVRDAFANGKAFIPFITCGDPSLEVTEQLVYACEEAGADLIELGIPFSDPTAEGPVIQAANMRALAGGVTTARAHRRWPGPGRVRGHAYRNSARNSGFDNQP